MRRLLLGNVLIGQRAWRRALGWRLSIVVLSAVILLASAIAIEASARPELASQAPGGFENLLRSQETLVDIYYGSRRLGEAMAVFEPGSLHFSTPAQVVKLIPRVSQPELVVAALTGPLPTHPELVCVKGEPENCGHLTPDVAGIIFDESHFRVEVFLSPAMLAVTNPNGEKYLPEPAAGLSLSDTIGGAISGTNGSGPSYSVQNRAVLGYHDARLTAELSQSSDLGLQIETLVGALDKPGMRYQAGLLWTPSLDFTGQSRIYGIGVGTQDDTRADHDQIAGNPLMVFLPRQSLVEIYRDGRLLTSKMYDAGNQILDSTSLPDGAYNVTVRIHEVGGSAREVQQFFVKNRSLPPLDAPSYFFDAGVLANNGLGPFPTGADTAFVEAGMARRLSDETAIDATALLIGKTFLTEVGGDYFTGPLRLHAAAFGATGGNYGLLLDGTVTALSALALNVDVRKTWGPGLTFLTPNAINQNSFTPIDLTAANQLTGNSLQIAGTLSYTAGSAQLGLTGTYLKSPVSPRSYSVGPTLNWPFWNDEQTAATLVATVTKSDQAFQAGMSLRIQFNRGNASLVGEAGFETLQDFGQRARTGGIGNLTGTFTQPDVLQSDLMATAGISRALEGDTATVEAQLRGAYGLYDAEADRGLDGSNLGTHFTANFVASLAANSDGVAFGGQDISESGIIVRLAGAAPSMEADVLIDGMPRGRITIGQSLPIFLPPYKTYSVRLQPVGAPSVDFDTGERIASLFPGNVETLEWDVEPITDVFGRALSVNGKPIADARIDGAKEPAMTDSQGYFQVEISATALLTLHPPNGGLCNIRLTNLLAKDGYVAVGSLTCRVEDPQSRDGDYQGVGYAH